ncbi:MAG: hypothetical protein KGQ70_08485, partial [Alphaproteobacteria bacterium]|nr:hypothetical protein [Alphaproteobacteria bacterium]
MFTVLLAGIAIAGVLSVVLYQTISGPMSSMVRVNNVTSAKSQMQSIGSIIIMNAVNLANNGDCDSPTTGTVKPAGWRAGSGPAGGGLVPDDIGAPLQDPWGTDYGYCVWKVGSNNTPSSSCRNNEQGTGIGMLTGTGTPSTSPAAASTVIAIISAGPDRTFQTTCSAYVNDSSVLVTQGDDDIVKTYTYEEA